MRLAETRLGYTVSLIWAGRVRHFAVSVGADGRHAIRGNPRKYRYWCPSDATLPATVTPPPHYPSGGAAAASVVHGRAGT